VRGMLDKTKFLKFKKEEANETEVPESCLLNQLLISARSFKKRTKGRGGLLKKGPQRSAQQVRNGIKFRTSGR